MADRKLIPPCRVADRSDSTARIQLPSLSPADENAYLGVIHGEHEAWIELDADTCHTLAHALTQRGNALEPPPAASEHVWMVIYDRGGIAGAWIGDRAEQLARNNAEASEGVLAKLPIVADYREVNSDD